MIVEFNLFNPTTTTLVVSSFFFERIQTGQATNSQHIDAISLHNTESILQVFQGICLIIFIAMVFYKIVDTIATSIRQGRNYLYSAWCWLDIAHLTTSISVVVVSFIKAYHTSESVQVLKRTIFATVNFQTALLWGDVENCMLAIITFLTTVKLLQLTYFNMYTRVFASALRIWMRDFFSFLFVLSVVFFAFLLTGILVFGSRVRRYSSVGSAFSFQLEIVLGKVKARPIKELIEANPAIGHAFVTLLLLGFTIILMNFFISTLNDAVSAAQAVEIRKEEQPGVNTSNQRSKTFFDHVSNQMKTIDVIQNLPQMYVLDKKLTEVLQRLDEACVHGKHE